MAVRNTRTSQDKRQIDATRRAQTASPIGYSSVTRGGLRIASEEGLTVQGSQRVTGRLYVDGYERVGGQLEVSGSLVVSGNADVTGPMAVRGPLTVRGDTTFVGPLRIEGSAAIVGPLRIEGRVDVTGPMTVSGAMTVTGQLEVRGPMTIAGKLDVLGDVRFAGDTLLNGTTQINGDTTIAGDTRLAGELSLIGSGSITVGRMRLASSTNSGNGGIASQGDLLLSASGDANIVANGGGINLVAVGQDFRVASDTIHFNGLPVIAEGTAGWIPVVVNGSGQLGRMA